jgi:hypothetical protein
VSFLHGIDHKILGHIEVGSASNWVGSSFYPLWKQNLQETMVYHTSLEAILGIVVILQDGAPQL